MRIDRFLGRFLGLLLSLFPAAASAEPSLRPGFFAVHRSEPFLLHRQVAAAELRKLKVWDPRLSAWRPMQPAEAPGERAPVLLLHLWADWCVPCREELPVLRDVMTAIEKTHAGRAHTILISENSSPEDMRAFLVKYGPRLPRAPYYLDVGEAIVASLRIDLPTNVSYPITLVLDQQRNVRHAIVGSIAGRRTELFAAIARLLKTPRALPQATSALAPSSIR
jgi:thiol-disulfide isomerase/thioredoxin